MELFIRANDIYMEIHKVALKDGYIPMIGDQLPSFLNETDYGYCNRQTIEPAIWFKVMVVDSISIDCTKRAIMWNSDSSLLNVEDDQSALPKQRCRRVAESMYIGGELYSFETDLGELFDSLQTTVVNFASSLISKDDFNSEVMRILHCHVLPLIKLTTEDIPKIKKLFAVEEQYIQIIDEAIVTRDKQMDGILKAMQRQRDAFLSSFINIMENDKSTLTTSAKLCNKELAEVLVDDCGSDLVELHQTLDDLQKEVEKAKHNLIQQEGFDADNFAKSVTNSISSEAELLLLNVPSDESEAQKNLREKREDRNECHGKLKRLLCARENLKAFISEINIEAQKQKKKSFIGSMKSSPKQQPLPIHNMYMGMRDTLKEVRNKTKSLIDQKVLLISVKEALRTTLQELEVNEESLGIDVGLIPGSRPTDVLHNLKKPREWFSLAEKVSELVGHHRNEVCLTHNNMCKIVADRCQGAVFEKKIIDISHHAGCINSLDVDSEPEKGDSAVYVENNVFSIALKKETRSDGVLKMPIEDIHIEQASPVNSIISDTSDLGTGSESRVSSGSMSQSESSSTQNDNTVTLYPPVDSLIQVEGLLDDEDVVIIHNNSRDNLRIAIDEVKTQVHEHFKIICKLIQGTINNNTQTATNRVWLCYENHFYESTMEPLMELYKNAFNAITKRLEQLVPHLTVEDLDLDNTVIANMLEEKRFKLPPEKEEALSPKPTSKNSGTIGELEAKPLSNALQTKSEPVSPSSDEVFLKVSEALPSIKKSGKVNITNFRRRLLTDPTYENVGKTPPKDQKLVQCTACQTAGGLQRIRVHSPMSITVVRNCQSWPQNLLLNNIVENPEAGSETMQLQCKQDGDKISSIFHNIRRSLFSPEIDPAAPITPPSPLQSTPERSDGVSPIIFRDVKLKPEFLKKFGVAKKCLMDTMEGVTPLIKLQSLMRCLREVTNCLSEYQFQYNNNNTGACSDDIIDMLIILLLNCDASIMATLYPHIMFLADTLPPFFEGGPYQFCLVQFSVAYQFIQDRLLLKNRNLHGISPSCIY